jgi:hypothetical protein
MSGCRAPKSPFLLKYVLFKRKKGITSLMSQKTFKKWVFFYRRIFLYDNKKAYFKKGLFDACILTCSFKQKQIKGIE